MNESTKIYCAYDQLNTPTDRDTGQEIHVCSHYNTVFCYSCKSRYNGDRVKKFIEDHPKH